MRFFGRRERPASGPNPAAAREFWGWWRDQGRETVTSELTADRLAELEPLLSQRVQAIHPELSWELSRGGHAEHALVITAAGDPALRPTARRWLQHAPPADATWEFHDTRQPCDVDGLTLSFHDVDIHLGDTVVGTESTPALVHVQVFNPGLLRLDARASLEAAFLTLDSALGEEATETWLGEVSVVRERPPNGMSLTTLRGVVAELAREVTSGDGLLSMLEARTRKGPLLAMVREPLRPMIAPHLDTHVLVSVPFTTRGSSGMPTDEGLEHLQAFEEHLTTLAGDSGRWVGVETCAGVRRIHFYADSSTPVVAQIDAGVAGWTDGRVTVKAEHDPGWDNVADLRAATTHAR
ncbi:MAG: DUF695 domain-containing protein [Actinomycetales bacterium]